MHHFYISRELCFATTTSSNSILLEMHSAMTVKNRWPRRRRRNSSKWIYYSHLWIFYIHWHLCKILGRPITMCRKTIKTLMMVFLSRFGYNAIPLNITIGKNCIFLGISVFKNHSSEIRGLCFMKWPSKMLQNLLYLWNMKIHVGFSFFLFMLLYFSPNECPGQCQHKPGHSLGKSISLGHLIKPKLLISEESRD